MLLLLLLFFFCIVITKYFPIEPDKLSFDTINFCIPNGNSMQLTMSIELYIHFYVFISILFLAVSLELN